MSKSNFIVTAVIVVAVVACGIFALNIYSDPKTFAPKQNARDKVLLESAKLLAEISKQLDRMEQDLGEIREKLTEDNI